MSNTYTDMNIPKGVISQKDRRIDELESALGAIKNMVIGDKSPNWATALNTCKARSWIADQCDRSLEDK